MLPRLTKGLTKATNYSVPRDFSGEEMMKRKEVILISKKRASEGGTAQLYTLSIDKAD